MDHALKKNLSKMLSRTQRFSARSNMSLTFDLYSDLALVSSCNVADDAQVSPLVLYPYAFYLQSPVAVGLKTVSFKIPLAVFGPVTDP